MGVPKKRTSSMRRDRRRAANYTLEAPSIATCPNCKEPIRPHTMCKSCGHYRGREVTAKKS